MPSFTRLNGDSSWLIETGGLRLLLDPWLLGAQEDVAPWFSRQAHVEPCVSLDVLGELDAVLISHPFTDHCHPETLKGLPAELPVIGPERVIRRVEKLGHFEHLHTLPVAQEFSFRNLTVRYYPPPGWWDPVHGGLFLSAGGEASIFYAPHGFVLRGQELLPAEVLITTFTRYRLPFFLGGTINLGGAQARLLARALGVSWIIPTHDEEKTATGLVARLARVEREAPASLAGEVPRVLSLQTGMPFRLSS